MPKIAVVRVRGIRNMEPSIKRALELLRLHRPNHCILLDESPSNRGVLQKVRDYVTFGPVGEKALFALLFKRGEAGGKLLREVKKEKEIEALVQALLAGKKADGMDPVFRLHPPRKGYKNLKLTYPRGALGVRPEMDTLLKRMM